MSMVLMYYRTIYNKEAEISGEETICAIFYLEKLDKNGSAYLKKRSENGYILNKE